MPPRTRTRGAKALKENADVENNFKNTGNVVKPIRKVLADKTNSLSDDNETVSEIKKVSTKLSIAIENNGRPRRQKRLPARFKENRVLSNLSTSQTNFVNVTTVKPPEPTKEVGSKKDNQETTQRQALKPQKKVINDTKDINLKSTKVLGTQEKYISTTNGRKRSQNLINSSNSENIAENSKVVHSKKSNIVTTHRTISEKEKKQVIPTKATKTKPNETPKKHTLGSREKSLNISTTSDKLAISNTFTPPSNKGYNGLEKSLVMNRPKRIHRLPSRFDDHSISPNKFIPVQPCHASTPLQKKHSVSVTQAQTKMLNTDKNKIDSIKSDKKLTNEQSPDSNNNPKSTRSAKLKVKPKTSPIKRSPRNVKIGKRLLDRSLSFKILDDNKKSKDNSKKLDVYEFTFNPDEEPQPQKKKKRVIKKKPSKPKTVQFKNNYDKNISKAMAALKDAVAKYVHPKGPNNRKETQDQNTQDGPKQAKNTKSNTQVHKLDADKNNIESHSNAKLQNVEIVASTSNVTQNQITSYVESNVKKPSENNGNNSVYENPPSIRIEDIEADCEISYHDDINYSPVNSPRPSSLNPMAVTHFNVDDRQETIEKAIHNKDPLNLQDDISFFDDQPVASSSMNISVRHPLASPWRVEFGSLPIKWQANTYLKPNMTPAVENSFISSEDSHKKKHVYVNMIPQTNESLPHIVENTMPNLKQPSIISFIKEVAERNAKKKRGKSVSPIKASALFEDFTNKINPDVQETTNKKPSNKLALEDTLKKNVSNSSNNTSDDKENVRVTRKRKNENHKSKIPAKSPRKENDKNITYFGFDDSENQDQENLVPNKNIRNNKVRALRSKSSKILQEINGQIEPTRAAIPLAVKTKITSSSEAVKRIYEELKSAEDAPQLLETIKDPNAGTTNIDICQNINVDSDEEESVHLFEDIDVVHHLKPTRKSYGKAKKVTFRQRSTSDSDTQASDIQSNNHLQSSDEDDLGDLSFTMPEIKQKKKNIKKKTKKIMSKKEEKEADEWAAGFNSMCEAVEEFPLIVE